jgi:hypothetical protein
MGVSIKAALDKAAKADKRSVSSLLQKIISDWLEANGFLKWELRVAVPTLVPTLNHCVFVLFAYFA